MSRDLTYESYYISQGGMIPVKWTAPEISNNTASLKLKENKHSFHRPFTTRNTPQPVMCGAMEFSCMRFGVWDTSPTKTWKTLRLIFLLLTEVVLLKVSVITEGCESC